VPRRGAGQRGGPLAGVLERIERWLTHGDLIPGNVLCSLAPGSPPCSTWLRARANALEQALRAVAHYTPRRHPLAGVMSRTLRRVLDDAAASPPG
jgi:hypothetical protein